MLVPYDQMPDNASVWVHQSDKMLSNEEVETLENELKNFIENWEAHGSPLKAAFKILHNRFVVIVVDESYTQTSGCSIDASMSLLKDFEPKLGTAFFNRLNVAYKDGGSIHVIDNETFKQYIEEGKITENTLVFNNLVKTKQELEEQWQVPVKESWHKRVLTQVSPALKQ